MTVIIDGSIATPVLRNDSGTIVEIETSSTVSVDNEGGLRAYNGNVAIEIDEGSSSTVSLDNESTVGSYYGGATGIALYGGRGGSAVGKAPIVWIESNDESNFYTAQNE